MMERRFLSAANRPIEVRAEQGQPPKIQGYAACFYSAGDPGTEYELFRYGDFSAVERLMPDCFDRAVREDDVRSLFNHDPDHILGRVRANTCRLSIDSIGLRYEIDPPDTQTARDLMESLKRGDVTGSSFSFDYLKKNIIMQQEGDKERDIIEVHDVLLYDVGPVTFPAYTSTTAGVRSVNEDALKRELDALRGERRRNAAGKRARARLLDLG
jgi:Escherichia/Staphylococcus phage prohead protease